MSELRELRKNIGITQEEAAKMVGVSRRTYQTYEENDVDNDTYKKIVGTLKNIKASKCEDVILSISYIKKCAVEIFTQHPEVRCAYLFGSYARGEADKESDVDILVVLKEAMGLSFFGMGGDLMRALGKRVDLVTDNQLVDDAFFIEQVLVDGIKIYVKQ